jgi:hypothetical protein
LNFKYYPAAAQKNNFKKILKKVLHFGEKYYLCVTKTLLKQKAMTTIQITNNLTATIEINEDLSVFVTTNYSGIKRTNYYQNPQEVIENTTMPAIKNYFINQ